MNEVFQSAQISKANHRKNLEIMDKLLAEAAPDQNKMSGFAATLMQGVHRIVLTESSETAVMNVILFISHHAAQHEEIFVYLMDLLLPLAGDAQGCVRLKVCQFVAHMFESVEKYKAQVEINEELFETLLDRLRDKLPAVREAAAQACQRLQSVKDARCQQLTAELGRLLQSDTNINVRKSALRNIVVSRETLPHIVSRTRDTNPDVRIIAYRVLREKIPSKSLNREQRKALIFEGLRDRDARVRDACGAMIVNNWLHHCNDDLLAFIELFDIEKHELTVEVALQFLFNKDFLPPADFWQSPVASILDAVRSMQSSHAASRSNLSLLHATAEGAADDDAALEASMLQLPDASQVADDVQAALRPGIALLWRAWIEYCKSRNDELALEALVPSAPDIHILISAVTSSSFVTKQLLAICHFVFLSTDECGRGQLSTTVRAHLESVSDSNELIPLAMKRLHELHPKTADFLAITLGIVGDLFDPFSLMSTPQELEEEVAALQAQLEGCTDAEEIAGIEAAIAEVGEKQEVQEDLKVFIYTRAFALIDAFLTLCQTRGLRQSEDILPILARIAEQVETNFSSDVVQAGLRCLCVLGLLDQQLAEKYFGSIFFHAFQVVDPAAASDNADSSLGFSDEAIYQAQLSTKIVALRCMFDLLAQYGPAVLLIEASPPEPFDQAHDVLKPSSPAKEIWREVAHLMGAHPDLELKSTVSEGVAKLLLLQKLENKALLVHAMLLFFLPATADAYRMRQSLHVFFEAFAERIASSRVALAQAYLSACVTILSSPDRFENFPLWELTQWVINLTTVDSQEDWELQQEAFSEADKAPHDILAEGLLTMVLKKNYNDVQKATLIKGLRQLSQLNRKNTSLHSKIQERTQRAIEERNDRTSKTRHSVDALKGFLYTLAGHSEEIESTHV